MTLRGDFLDSLELVIGSSIEMEIEIESKEIEGKWNTCVVSTSPPISSTREENSGISNPKAIVVDQATLDLFKNQMEKDEEEGW